MDRIRIGGGRKLEGNIRISGAKNAALPLLTATLLTAKTVTLTNLPKVADIRLMSALLAQHGSVIEHHERDGGGIDCSFTAEKITSTTAPYELVRKMRASVLVLGPLVAREGTATVSLPGGCAIGTRPVDIHLTALEKMGAEIELQEGYIHAVAPKGLKGAEIVFPMVSVGATENILMAATLAEGETVMRTAAKEPEIVDLGECLKKMGAQIEGLGTDTIRVRGVAELGGCEHRVVADRIEAGSFALAAAITDGDLTLEDVHPDLIGAVIDVMVEAGISVERTEVDGMPALRVRRANGPLVGVDVMTDPFPGFPTDMQAQMMALMAVAEGASMITESIFENRFMHVPELMRMGANINLHGSSAMVRGVKSLKGAPVMATDLRASMSLVLAALVGEGDTIIDRVYHLDRGYEQLEAKLAACGADIERLQEPA